MTQCVFGSIHAANVHCLHSAMFFKMLGFQLGPAVSIEIYLLSVASLNSHLDKFHQSFKYNTICYDKLHN